MEEQQRKEKDSSFQMKSEVGQDCNQGMAAWADPQQRGVGAKEGEDDTQAMFLVKTICCLKKAVPQWEVGPVRNYMVLRKLPVL